MRGMHFQYPPAAQTKYVGCTRGSVLDIMVDRRPESPTFLEHVEVELTADNHRAIYIAERFAHGYQVLEDLTETSYQWASSTRPEARADCATSNSVAGRHGGVPPRKARRLVNAELDATIGPILQVHAEEHGLTVSATDGDDPGLQMNLYRWVKGIGLTPRVMGNVKGLQDRDRNPETRRGFAESGARTPRWSPPSPMGPRSASSRRSSPARLAPRLSSVECHAACHRRLPVRACEPVRPGRGSRAREHRGLQRCGRRT
jgi:hypothetical protein